MKILIGMPTYDRRIDMEIVKTMIRMERETDHEYDHFFPQSCFLAQSRNLCVKTALDAGSDYLLFWDSDTSVPDPQFINRLLETGYKFDAGIIGGAYRIKEPDISYRRYAMARRLKPDEYQDKKIPPGSEGRIYTNIIIEKPELVDAVGTGIMLIKREVIEKMEQPWFTVIDGKEGFTFPEDWEFCRKAQELGYIVACDPRFTTRHIGNYAWEHTA